MESVNSVNSTAVYGVKYFFRGRRIAAENDPPADLVDVFLDFITGGLVCPGFDQEGAERHKHFCDENCAIETCIVLGRPYTDSVKEALEA